MDSEHQTYLIKQNHSSYYYASGNPYDQWTHEKGGATQYSSREVAQEAIEKHNLNDCRVVRFDQ